MPKGLRKFKFIFGATGLTCWGGLSLFAQFCKSLWLKRYLQRYAIVARMHKSLKSQIVSCRYHEFAKGWEATDFTFPVQNSKSSFKAQTLNLTKFANILSHRSDDERQKNSVYSRFSGREDKEDIGKDIGKPSTARRGET
jgi:hypothetical protein